MKVRISPGAILMLAVLAAGRNMTLPATLTAALLHECGHLLAAWVLDIRLRLLEFDLFGAKLYPAELLPSYPAEVMLAASGPMASMLLWGLLLPFSAPFAVLLRNTSLALGVFNLMPVAGFDGGRILFSAMALWKGAATAERAVAVTSYLSLLFLFALSACMLLRFGQNMALAVLSASLFAKIFLPHNMER